MALSFRFHITQYGLGNVFYGAKHHCAHHTGPFVSLVVKSYVVYSIETS